MNLSPNIPLAACAIGLTLFPSPTFANNSLTLNPEHVQSDQVSILFAYDSFIHKLTGRSRKDVYMELSMKGYVFPSRAAAKCRTALSHEEYLSALRFVNESNHFGYYNGASIDIAIPPSLVRVVIILVYRQDKLQEHLMLSLPLPHTGNYKPCESIAR